MLDVVPLSGHTLFLSYTFVTTPPRGYRALVIAVLLETTYLKLVRWHDPITWGMGIVLGLALAAAFRARSA